MKVLRKVILLALFISTTIYSKVVLESSYENMKYKVEEVFQGDGVIWGMDFLDEENLIFTEKSGSLFILNIKTKELKKVNHSLSIFHVGQGGLLDVKVSPTYEKDGMIFITYSKRVLDKGATTLIKGKIKNNKLVEVTELLESKSFSKEGYHFGSRIAFDKDNNVYFSIGDRGFRNNSQDLSNHAGTVIRINMDGTVPSSNPFLNKSFALKEIFSYGHRNPQGLFYDKNRETLFSIEHGPRGGDEINIIQKGKNYGWPVISHGKEYWNFSPVGEGTHKKGMEQAIKVYIPSIAPSSLIVYEGQRLKSLEGKVLSTALKLRHLNIITLDKNLKVLREERVLKELNERLRNIVQSPDGSLYISSDSGKIFQLK